MAAILNFSKTLKKSPAHLHIVGNVIVKFAYFLTSRPQEFLRSQKNLELTSGGHLKFGSIFKKKLAHPHVAKNVMLKFKKKLTKQFF